ncbi:MAG TPA: HEAT repeat domain-containing protein, partial [Coleofasciculaceae cyanobacterium]
SNEPVFFPIEDTLYPYAPGNPEKLVRVNAAIALGKLGSNSAIPALTTALKDNNPWMQLATSWALLRLGQTQGLPVVGRLVQYPNSSIQEEALLQLRGYGLQSAPYILPYYTARLDSADDNERNNAIIQIGKYGPAALDLVPKLRALLVSNKKDSPGYAATILGEIARDTAIAWQNGSLSANQRQQAIAELTKVLNIMQAPNARFNREPIERIRNGLTTLRGVM